MKRLHQLYDGQSKIVYATDEPDMVMLSFKDEATCYGGLKRARISGKGAVCNQVSNHLMRILEKNGIPTHYVEEVSETDTLVKKIRLLPIAVICRNRVAGTLAGRLGVPDGTPLPHPIIEFHYRGADLNDRLVNEYHITAMGWGNRAVLAEITAMAEKINSILKQVYLNAGIELVDMGLEFGFTLDGTVVLGDELSPDTSRLWDSRTHEKLDKDRFRRDLGDVEEAYQEVLHRLMGE